MIFLKLCFVLLCDRSCIFYITMALAEPRTQTDDYNGMSYMSSTETISVNTEIAIIPHTSDMDVNVWGIWWPVHCYAFGTLFAMLSIYALYATILRILINQSKLGGIRSRKSVQPVFTCINVIVFVLGLSNAIMLFIDPYLKYRRLPLILSVILFNMPYPCMTSAFALVNWVLISISQMRITKSSRLRSVWFLCGIIATHFLLVLGTCFVFAFYESILVLGIMCHGFFVVWGALLCITYIYSAWKIMSAAKTNRKALYDISMRDSSANKSVMVNGGSKISRAFPKKVSAIFTRNMKRQDSCSNDKNIFSISQKEDTQEMALSTSSFIKDCELKCSLPVIDDVSRDTEDKSKSIYKETTERDRASPTKSKITSDVDSSNTTNIAVVDNLNTVSNSAKSMTLIDKRKGTKYTGDATCTSMGNRQESCRQKVPRCGEHGGKSGAKMSGAKRPQVTQKVKVKLY